MRAVGIFSLGDKWARGHADKGEAADWTRGSAKVQIGAELLCKSAKVNLGVGVGVGAGKSFGPRLSGLGHLYLDV